MKKKKLIILFLYLIILTGCKKTEKSPILKKGTVVITGKINNLGTDSKTIRFASESTVKNIEKTAIINSEGKFSINFELYHAQTVRVVFKNSKINLYLKPSDSIHLDIDETLFLKEKLPEFEISGRSSSSKTSKEIQEYLKYRGEVKFKPNLTRKTVKEFLLELKKETEKQNTILDLFIKKHNPTEEFSKWANKHVKYFFSNSLLIYKFSNQNYEGNLFDESIFPINDDNAIITSKYALHLKHYALNIGIWQDSTTLNHLKNKNYSDAYKRSLNTIIGNVEKGLSRDLMCYKSLSSLLDLSYIDYDIVSQKIDTYIENNILKEVLREKENDYKNKKKLNITLLDPKTNEEKKITGDFWAELKEKFKGKVVYIDIWTTWCAPCRLEIPHAIRLHNYFKVKNIAFVNLCLESNKNEWQKMIKSKNIKGYNYFLNQAQSQMLRAKLEFDGYPTYLIIDKKGNLVNKNAPRPSSNEDIKDVLNKWIEEKNP